MKFTWFNLMPWPHLPDDFTEKHRSVWVDLPPSMFDPEKGHVVYNDYLDLLEYAEEVGFDGIGVNEHHANAYGLMPSPNIMAATLSRRTSKAALVVLGNSLSLYNPPLRVAEEFAMLDCISGGRLVAGFPVGSSMDVNYAYGDIPAFTREKYHEAHDLITQAWAADEPFAFNGKFTKMRYVNCWPKPVQKPLPIHVPGSGSLETYDFCLERDYSYSYLSFSGYKRGKKLLQGFWDRADEMGKDLSPYRGGFAQIVAVADTDEEAEQMYAPHMDYFFNRCMHVWQGFTDAPGYRTVKTIFAGVLSQMRTDNLRVAASLSWADLIERGYIIAGSPATVRERMEDMIKGLHVGNVFAIMHTGDMPTWKCRKSTQLFGEEVLPHLRNIWPDHEDDNRFWINPMEDRQVPGLVSENKVAE